MRTRIAERRRGLGLTQERLAGKVDVTRQTIVALEQGRYNPSLLLAYSIITKALRKKHIEDLFDFEGL